MLTGERFFVAHNAPQSDSSGNREVMIQTKDLQSQDARRNFCDLAQIPLPQPWSGSKKMKARGLLEDLHHAH